MRLRVYDFHRAPAKYVGRAHKYWIADSFGHLDGFFAAARDAVLWLLELQSVDQRGEAFAILGKVDGVRRCAQYRDARCLQRLCKVQRRLPPKLDDYTLQRAIFLLDMQDFQNIFSRERFEIQTVRRVIVGRDRFGVAVDHDRFIACISEREAGMDAAIIEFDPLPDAIWSTAQDDNLFAIRRLALALRRTKARRFIG